MPSERECIERERAAAAWAMREFGLFSVREVASIRERTVRERFPLPKVTRPRVVKDSAGYEWRCNDNHLEWRLTRDWHRPVDGASWRLSPDNVRLWADLLANPTEEVDDGD